MISGSMTVIMWIPNVLLLTCLVGQMSCLGCWGTWLWKTRKLSLWWRRRCCSCSMATR